MYILVTYDVETKSAEGRRRLRKVAKCCVNHGQRVQNSVFECALSEAELVVLRAQLKSIIDINSDSIRIYHFGNNYHAKIEHIGVETSFDMEGTLLI